MKNLKKCSLLIAVLALALLAVPALASTVESGTSRDGLTWSMDSDGTLTISGSGAMADYYDWIEDGYSYTAPWWSYDNQITSVVIGNGVTCVGANAFWASTNLEAVSLPSSVTSIHDRAFSYSGLTAFTIPEGVVSLGESVFEYCENLTSITIPASVTSMWGSAFSGCTNLTSIQVANGNMNYSSADGVLFDKNQSTLITYPCGLAGEYTIPNSVTSIGNYAFMYCSGLTNVTIPDSVTSIGFRAFDGCYELTDLTIPDHVTSIGDYAFDCCFSLTSITIPASVTSIGESAFEHCSNLAGFIVDSGNANYSSENGVLFNKGKTTLIACPCGLSNNYVIPASVTSIDPFAFKGCRLTSLEIPTSVSTIDYGAFEDTLLDHVDYGGTIAQAKAINISLSNENLKASVWHCTDGDWSAIIPLALDVPVQVTVGAGETVYFYYSVKESGTYHFSSSGDFDTIGSLYDSWIAEDMRMAFDDNSGEGQNFDVVRNLGETGMRIYYGAEFSSGSTAGTFTVILTLEDPTVWSLSDDGVLTITGNGPMHKFGWVDAPWYSRRDEITSLVVSEGITTIGEASFNNCHNLTRVYLPDSLTFIEYGAFFSCSSLTDVYYAGTEEDWNDIYIDIENNCLTNAAVTYNASAPLSASGSCGDDITWSFDGATLTLSGSGPTWDYEDGAPPWEEFAGTIEALVVKEGITSIHVNAFMDFKNVATIYWPASITVFDSITFYIDFSDVNAVEFYYAGTQAQWDAINWTSPAGYEGLPDNFILTTDHPFQELNVVASGVCGAEGDNLTWTLYDNGMLRIAGTGAMADYGSRNQAPWRWNTSSVNCIKVEEGVTSLGNWAFRICPSLESITLPTTLQRIGSYAFDNDRSLTSITIPAAVTEIGDHAFIGCEPLRDIHFDGTSAQWQEISIGKNNYAILLNEVHCSDQNLSPITATGSLGNGVSFMLTPQGKLTITGSGEWNTEQLYPGVTGNFYNNGYIRNVILEPGVTEIHANAFSICQNLTSVTLPTSLETIGENAFNYCSMLADVNYAGSETDWSQITIGEGNECLTGASFTYDYTESQYIASGECGADGGNVTWTLDGDGVMTISGSGAMANIRWDEIPWADYREMILTVVVEPGVTSIGSNAFYNCQSLMSVTLPNTLTSIGGLSFSRCQALTSISLPDTLTHIGGFAFESCTGLTSVTLPGGLAELGEGAFAGSGLTEVLVQAGTDTRYEYFYEADKQNHPYFYRVALPENTVVGDGPFLRSALPANMVPDFTTPASLTTIEAEAFYGIDASFIWLTDNVTSIGERAFAACEGLQYIRIPYQCTSIGTDAIPEGVSILCEWGTDAWNYANANNCEKIPYGEGFN